MNYGCFAFGKSLRKVRSVAKSGKSKDSFPVHSDIDLSTIVLGLIDCSCLPTRKAVLE